MKSITTSWDNMKMLEIAALALTPGISMEIDGDEKTLTVKVE
jgi:hypothetical protein